MSLVNRPLHFSKHAFDVIQDRTALSPDEIAAALAKKLCVNMGCKPGLSKAHLLFYSPVDQHHFVAVQDQLDGEVVTVWPLEYHENLAWKVPEEQKTQAKTLLHDREQLRYQIAEGNAPSSFFVSALFTSEQGKCKSKELFSVSANDYERDVEVYIKKGLTLSGIKVGLVKKGLLSLPVHGVSVKLGSRGSPIYVSLDQVRNS